jgi:hypothetical protein
MQANDSLKGAARRRSEMELAMQRVERTTAAPAANTTWVDDLTHAVRQLEIALNHHIVEVEAPSGLLDQIVDTAPRLQRTAEQTRAHHLLLAEQASALLGRIGEARGADPLPVDDIRASVLALLAELARHRQKGADLIYEAYDVDIGGY